MKVVLIGNRSAGRGNGAAALAAIASALRGAVRELVELTSGPHTRVAQVDEALANADAAVIAGGDGTVHHSLPSMIRAGVPVYHAPFGTENLFARQFKMTRDPDAVLGALRRWSVQSVDVGECSGRPFVLMCSVGLDACIVQRVAAARRSGVRRMSYVLHGLAEAVSPRVPTLTVEADGRRVVDRRQGLVIVANSRQYAARLDPAREASMTDGLLDVVFLPHAGTMGFLSWLPSVLIGSHMRSRHAVRVQSHEIRMTTESPAPWQIDGEDATGTDGRAPEQPAPLDLRFTVRPGVLRVLVP